MGTYCHPLFACVLRISALSKSTLHVLQCFEVSLKVDEVSMITVVFSLNDYGLDGINTSIRYPKRGKSLHFICPFPSSNTFCLGSR